MGGGGKGGSSVKCESGRLSIRFYERGLISVVRTACGCGLALALFGASDAVAEAGGGLGSAQWEGRGGGS